MKGQARKKYARTNINIIIYKAKTKKALESILRAKKEKDDA